MAPFKPRATIQILVIGVALLSASAASADLSFYSVHISSSTTDLAVGDRSVEGYAKIDWSNTPEVKGELCLVGRGRQNFQGRNISDGELDLSFIGLSDLGIGSNKIRFKKRLVQKDVNWNYVSDKKDDDAAKQNLYPKLYEMHFARISSQDTKKPTQNEWLLSKMSMEQGFLEEMKNPPKGGDGGIAPGKISIVVRADRTKELDSILRAIGAGPLRQDIGNSCEAPVLTEFVSVIPLLEGWSAAKVATSGTVVSANVIVMEAGVATLSLATKLKRFTDVVNNVSLSVAERDAKISENLLEVLRAFTTERRRAYARLGTIIRLPDNTPFFYRYQLTGLALSVCDRARWEKIIAQFFLHRSYTDADRKSVV